MKIHSERLRHATRLALGAASLASVYFRRGTRPFAINQLVTVRCNLACPFCFVSGPEQEAFNRARYPRRTEMTTAEMRRFYRDLVASDFRLAVVLGGEPLLRADLGECLHELAGRLFVTVFTNGYLLSERAELLKDATNVFVSLDAPDEKHDELRARPGSFKRAVDGIEVLRRRYPRTTITINTTLTVGNVARVREMIVFARSLGVAVAFQPPSFEGQFTVDERPFAKSQTHTPSQEAVAEAFRAIRDAARRGARIIGTEAFFNLIIEDRKTYPCHYPAYVLGPILPNGDVVACVSSRVIANVRESSVRDIVAGAPFRENAAQGPVCPRGCRDWGLHDISAIRNRTIRYDDIKRVFRAFAPI